MQRLTVPEGLKIRQKNNNDISGSAFGVQGKRTKIISPKYKNHNYSNIATASYDLAVYKLNNADNKK